MRKLLKVKANWIKLGIFCDEELEVVPGWRFLLVPQGCLHVRFQIEIFVSSTGLFTCAISYRDFPIWHDLDKTYPGIDSVKKISCVKLCYIHFDHFDWPTRPLLFFIFGLFKQTSLQYLQQIYVKKCPSSIRWRDSNPQPSDCESLPITTRPGLLPIALPNYFSNAIVLI